MKKSPPRKRNHDGGEPERVRRAVERPAAHGLRIAQFRGPLPPPAVLERYDRLLPGAACVTAYLEYLGHASAAGLVGGTTVLGLATVFAMGRRSAPAGHDGPA